ncbi:MAG: hypothetical protein HDS65_03580 [Bacteroidales bacterium]|nr:hypothetical protein [Bacteroidales bacterium]
MNLKHILFFTAACCAAFPAVAEDSDEKAESSHVEIILADGDTITGYMRNDAKTILKNMFSKTGTIRQYINVGKEPKGGETQRYNAPQICQYRFLEATEGYPEGAICVSDMINSPGLFKPMRFVRGFAWLRDRRESGSIMRWDVWESTGGQNSITRLVPAIGVRFKGAAGAIPVMVNGRFSDSLMLIYLKKKYPDLYKAWNEYFHKSKDAKAHRREFSDNPSSALLFYEDFMQTHDPLNDEITENDEPTKEDEGKGKE